MQIRFALLLPLMAGCARPPAAAPRARIPNVAGSDAGAPSAPVLADTGVASSASASPAPAPATTGVVLYDPERGGGWGSYRSPKISLAIDTAEASAILGRAFPKSLKSCWTMDGKDLPDARGSFAARVEARMEGSFTTPHARQNLYVVDVDECGAGPMTSERFLVLVEGDAVVAEYQGAAPGIGPPVLAVSDVFDLDGDGRLEVLITETAMQYGGYANEEARLVNFNATGPVAADASLTTLEDFGEVYSSNCGSTDAARAETFSILRATTRPEMASEFHRERRTRKCR